jgi:flagellar protein FliS
MSYATQSSVVARAYSAYSQVQNEAADPRHMLVVLFDGLLRVLQEGRRHLAAGQFETWADCSNRVRRALSELILALDDEHSPELCGSLRALYVYIQRLITEAGLEEDMDKLQEAIDLMAQLGSAWREAKSICQMPSA